MPYRIYRRANRALPPSSLICMRPIRLLQLDGHHLGICHRPLRVFTLKVCSHLTFAFVSTSPSKLNIASMEMQTQMHRMGLNPFLTFYIDAMLNVDTNANANGKCEHTFSMLLSIATISYQTTCTSVSLSITSIKVPMPVISYNRLRICLHRASVSTLRQLCDDASDSALIEINGDA